MKEAGEALREAQKTLREAAESDDINEAQIREISTALANKMAAMAILKAQMKKECEAVLTPEQKTKMVEKKAEMKKNREERRAQMKERMQQRKGGEGGEEGKGGKGGKRRRKGDEDAE